MVCNAVESVLAQAIPVDEIVVVDDGSADNTVNLIQKKFPEVNLLQTGGNGPGAARNTGVEASSGDVIMFLDSDDCWLPNHANDLMQPINRGFDVAYGITRTRDELSGGEFLIPAADEGRHGDCFDALLRWCFLVPSAVAVTRKAFDHIGGFIGDEKLIGEDWLFFLRLAGIHKFAFVEKEISCRSLHAGSLCCLADSEQIRRSLKCIRRNLQTPELPKKNSTVEDRFRRMENWVAENGGSWSTVQDWYLSMKNGGLI